MSTRALFIASALAVAAAVQAQTPVPPFASPIRENFDALAPGSTASFSGFAGTSTFSRIGAGGAMIINSGPFVLPPVSPPNDMFGRGVDVRIRFKNVRKLFGGQFRVAKAGVTITKVRFQFFKGANPVGAPVTGPVSTAAWTWYGYDLSKFGGYDRVDISGLGGSLPGYVGMDDLVRK